ncbi:unnamed protein product, partial [Laminaria digitata]
YAKNADYAKPWDRRNPWSEGFSRETGALARGHAPGGVNLPRESGRADGDMGGN